MAVVGTRPTESLAYPGNAAHKITSRNMNMTARLFSILTLFLMTSLFSYGADSADREPDFAYPRTVAAEAESALHRADLNSNAAEASALRLRAALELLEAQRRVNPDTVFGQPALVAGLAAKTANFAPGQAMFTLLEARVLANIYNNARYRYDEVSAPAEPLPAKVEQWSGEQFKNRIKELVNEAVTLAAHQQQELSLYEASLQASDLGMTYVPTVYDFVAYRGCGLLSEVGLEAECDSLKAVALGRAATSSPAFFFWTAEQPDFHINALDIYRRYADAEAARYLLLKYEVRTFVETQEITSTREMEYVDMLAESLLRFPDWVGNDALRGKYRILTNPTTNVDIESMVGADTDTEVTGRYCWADKIAVDVYFAETARGDRESEESYLERAARVMTYSKVNDADTRRGGEIKFTVPAAGRHGYLVLKCTLNDTIEAPGLAIAEVMSLTAFGINSPEMQGLAVVDFTTGRPLRNVDVLETVYNRYGRERDSSRLGATGRDGAFLFRPDSVAERLSRYLSVRYRGHNYDFGRRFSVRNIRPERNTDIAQLRVITDRPLYHPGDTLEWAVAGVVFDTKCAGSTATGNGVVELYDVNNTLLIDSKNVVLDSLGRANGSFAIPRGRLTGLWRITFSSNNRIESQSVEVSDFRMPVFEVEVTGIERDVPTAGAVRISGKATSYAGMSLGGVRIAAAISSGTRWFGRFEPFNELGNVDTITGASGTFVLDIPASMLSDAGDNTDFCARITATTAAGETAFTEARFTTGKPYTLTCAKPSGNVDVDAPVQFLIKAEDVWGKNTPVEVQWRVTAADSTVVACGNAVTGTPFDVDLAEIPAGTYSIHVTAADTTLAAGADFESAFRAYSIRRNAVPPIQGFFPAATEAEAGGRLTIGVNRDKAWIYAITINDNNEVRVKVHELRRGFSSIEVAAAAKSLRLVTVENGDSYEANIEIKEPAPRALGIVAETFRDRLTPGQRETWRFRISDGEGRAAAGAAMVARMYNRALDALAPYGGFNTPEVFRLVENNPYLFINSVYFGYAGVEVRAPLPPFANFDDSLPAFRFMEAVEFYRPMMKMLMARSAVDMTAPAVNAMFVEADAEMEEAVTADAAPAMGAAPEATEADGGEAEPQQPQEMKYRPSEVLQAFFEPALTADADGNVDVVFTVPDANGSWAFQALVWNSEALSALYQGTAVSSKPVMVQPALPRFLRQGDKARLLTTVYNNTGSEAAVTTVAEIFDIATGAAVATATATDTIAADGSAIVAIDVTAPTDAAAVGFRVRATDGTFADGEQTAIPVLASAATVVESTEFYVNPNTAEPFTTDIDMEPGFSYTLQYCDNPIWTVVKALRGTSGANAGISTSLASHIFSLLAAGIVADANPGIAQVVDAWRNADHGALTSMLSRNADLKLLMLDRTPWLQTANDESARMASLAALFDGDSRRVDLDKALGKLRDVQLANGGFAWASWSGDASPWATRTILTTFGLARSLGAAFDSDTQTMLRRALDYVCADAVGPRHPDTDETLAILAALYPDYEMPADATGIVAATRRDIERHWRRHSTADKAWDIIILGHDNSVSAQILASLRQFGVVRPGMGMCFPSVDDMRSYATIMQAYKLMDAPANEMDAMRQWVIVQAQATDDLSAYNPDYIIAALITSGTDWTRTAPMTNVTLGGEDIHPAAVEAASGYFAMPLSGTGERSLVVAGNGITPAYGSVTAIGRRPAATVAARPGRDIAITKRVLVNRGGEWVATDSLRLGERARVQLTLTAGRDMEYVAIVDERPASFAPVEQLPGRVYSAGLAFYRVNADAETDIFIGYLPAGTYQIQYDMTAAVAGEFISGIATVQSQYDPALTAHSAGNILKVND